MSLFEDLKKLLADLPAEKKTEAEKLLDAMADAMAEDKKSGEEDAKAGLTQDQINALIDKRYEKAYAKAKTEYEDKIKALEAKLKKPDSNKKDGSSDENKSNEGYISKEELEKLLEQKDKEYSEKEKTLSEKLNSLSSQKKTAAIINAAAKLNAINPEVVAKLCADTVKIDESGNIFIANENGNPIVGTDGKELTIDKHVESFLKENEYLVKPSGTQGAGSNTQGGGQSAGNNVSLDNLATMSTADYEKNADALYNSFQASMQGNNG